MGASPCTLYNIGSFSSGKCSVQFTRIKSGVSCNKGQLLKGGVTEKRLRTTALELVFQILVEFKLCNSRWQNIRDTSKSRTAKKTSYIYKVHSNFGCNLNKPFFVSYFTNMSCLPQWTRFSIMHNKSLAKLCSWTALKFINRTLINTLHNYLMTTPQQSFIFGETGQSAMQVPVNLVTTPKPDGHTNLLGSSFPNITKKLNQSLFDVKSTSNSDVATTILNAIQHQVPLWRSWAKTWFMPGSIVPDKKTCTFRRLRFSCINSSHLDVGMWIFRYSILNFSCIANRAAKWYFSSSRTFPFHEHGSGSEHLFFIT